MDNSENVFGILFVSPRVEEAGQLAAMLSALPVVVDHVLSFDEVRREFDRDRHRIILTEAILLDGSWRDVLSLAQQAWPTPLVLVTDKYADSQLWAEVLHLGGHDVLAQPFAEEEVLRIFRTAYDRVQGSRFVVEWAR